MFQNSRIKSIFRRSRASRLRSGQSRLARRCVLSTEFLENRIALTGNLAVTGVAVVNSSGSAISNVSVGESVFIQIDFSTLNLPSNASYIAAITVNGLTLDTGAITWGAGASGSGSWNLYWGAWGASPGTNQVTVNLDSTHSVAETSYADNTRSFSFNTSGPAVGNVSITPAQMRNAYGINSIPNFGTAAADGTGQTIALVEAGNDPTILTDLDGFDQAMSLTTTSTESIYQQYGSALSMTTVYNQSGTNITANIADSGSNGVPAIDPTGHWEGEETLDVEWAHAMAPGARIDIIEVVDDNNWPTNLLNGDKLAASLPGVSAISNSWGLTEWSGETAYDSSTFVTPAGHTGVTFLTASNDNGANVYPSPPASPAPTVGNDGYYPATSPNVVSVGGTQLTLNNDSYGSETSWSYPTPTSLTTFGSSSYSQSGSWTSQSGGFSGTYGTAAGGSSSKATWTVPITTANTGWGTELSTTWTASPGNATNATYTIYDGTSASGTILGTVTIDQTKSPIGTADGGSNFQELGVFFPTLNGSGNGTLTVVLNAGTANGKVVADAIGGAQGWASTGGPTRFEAEPAYQLPFQSTGYRISPDISFDASEDSGVTCYQNGSLTYGGFGTSLGSPCWAGLIAIVNQGRVAHGASTLNSPSNPTQTLQALYSLPASDYHDITTGYNGFTATAGYDDVTGLGSPIVNLLVPALASYDTTDQLEVTGQPPATVTAGSSFGLTFNVVDPSGNTVTSYNGIVTISLASNPGGGSLGGSLTASAVNGVVTFNGLFLDNAASGYEILATANSLTSGTTNLFNVQAAAPSQLVIASEPPAIVTAGSVFGLIVDVEDPFGNLVTSDNGNVVVAIGTNPGSGTLGGTLTVSAVSGVVNFSNLTLKTAGTGYTLKVSRSGVTGETTTPITVNPSTASKLVITQAQPSGIVAGVVFGLVVAIEDAYGNVETGDNALVTASLKSGTGPLLGTTTASTSNGVASFTNLADDKAEIIAINVASPGLTGTFTANFVVKPAAASQLVIQTQPSASAGVAQPFAIQPVIDEEDAFGNLETFDSTTVVTASMASGAGPLQGTTTAVVSAGVAKFTNLADSKIETITLAFGSGALAQAISGSIAINKATPTIALTRSTATATHKQSITFTVAVASGGTTPTGSVTFFDGSTVLGSATLNSSGHASFSTTALPLGTQSITAKYAGDSTNGPVTSTATSVYVGDLPNDDFDGDGKADAAVFGLNPTTGKYGFTIVTSSSGFKSTVIFNNFGYGFGNSQSIPVVGDYFGDGKDAYALWTPNSLGGMTFTAVSSVSYKTVTANFGGVNQIPVVADVDGDGKADFGVYGYLPGYGYSFDFLLSTDNFNVNQQDLFNNNGYGYGNATSIPVVADFDGNGKADFGLYNLAKTGATFTYIDPSTYQSITQSIPLSLVSPNAIPMAVQYDGDGKADLALYGSSATNANQYGYVVLTAASGFNPSQAVTFNNNGYGYGNSSSIPVMADFDGTGKDDFAVYTPDFNGGMEYVFQTSQTGAGVTVDFPTSLTELPLATSPAFLAKKVRGS